MHVIAGIGRAAGTTVFCTGLCDELAARGHVVGLFACVAPGEETQPPRHPGVTLELGRSRRFPGLPRVMIAPGTARGLARLQARIQPEIVHVHALWSDVVHAGVAGARRNRLPLVFSPHGMLTPWSLRHHAWRKKLAWWMGQGADLRQAALLHATAPDEAEDLRRLGFRQPIAIVPLGVDMPAGDAAGMKAAQPPARLRTVLFLSRIHPKKGLLDLVTVWARLRPQGWRVVVAGPDEGGHRAEVESLAGRLGVASDFVFPGPVYAQARDAWYDEADLFVLPSYSENFGVVIPEALAHGVPVITTHATPWEALQQRNCGWWVAPGVDPLAGALAEAINLNDAGRRAMGERGRQLVRERYAWSAVAEQMTAAYAWILAGGPPPECVRID